MHFFAGRWKSFQRSVSRQMCNFRAWYVSFLLTIKILLILSLSLQIAKSIKACKNCKNFARRRWKPSSIITNKHYLSLLLQLHRLMFKIKPRSLKNIDTVSMHLILIANNNFRSEAQNCMTECNFNCQSFASKASKTKIEYLTKC